MNKSRKRVEQDYARNAIADGNTKAGKYEAKMAVKEAAGESPAKMYGKKKDSPAHNQNKGYESAGQERKNLMNDNPVASHGSWMAKHSQSRMGSPMKMDYGSPMEKELVGKQENLPEALKAKIEAAPEMRREGSPMHQEMTVYNDRLNKKGQTQEQIMVKKQDAVNDAIKNYNKRPYPATEKAVGTAQLAYKKSKDSINTS